MKNLFRSLTTGQKQFVVVIYDCLVSLLVTPISFYLRIGNLGPQTIERYDLIPITIMTSLVCVICFNAYKLQRGIWRFSSVPDLVLILKASATAILVSALCIFFWNRLDLFPRSVFFIEWSTLVFLLGGGRFAYRVYKESENTLSGTKTVIYGAGFAGEQIIRDIKKNGSLGIHIQAILDDNKKEHKRTLHGINIVGGLEKLELLVRSFEVTHVVIAIPSANSQQIRRIVDECLRLGLKVRTLPSLSDIVGNKVHISQLRPVNVEDLLGREPVNLDINNLGKLLSDKVILVTGAGGSIGSELCEQISRFKPQKIILMDNGEYNLYRIDLKLKEKFSKFPIIPVIGDIKNQESVEQILNEYEPQIVFHAAAYKHVPMMECNSYEAIKNNIFGTQNLALACSKKGVEKFVLISTDKAVNPTNVMGATKRVAEMVCQYVQSLPENKTNFCIVRFGNVLGSAGSVIPRFIEQLKEGKPLTVTHPEITRYFMSIPEASQLVLQAGTLGKGGEIFVLDMGEPVKIVDLATDLIKLSGLKPNEDVKIEFTGLRPAEKLYEELLADEENSLPTEHEKVRVACARHVPEELFQRIDHLKTIKRSSKDIKSVLQSLVPEYQVHTVKLENEFIEGSFLQ